jgi:hypothetical protein
VQYGIVEIDGQQYVERAQVFPADLNVTTNFQIFTQQRVTLPGVANFLLKGLTRETTANGVSSAIRFKFRLGNSDGLTWYISGGLGSLTDRALDTLVFGSGMFPYPIIPPIPYSAGANIVFEVEDISGAAPYTINFAFHGSYLIPVGAAVPGSVSLAQPAMIGA